MDTKNFSLPLQDMGDQWPGRHQIVDDNGTLVAVVFQNPAALVLACNTHQLLVDALQQARAALARCPYVPGVTEQAIWAADTALAKAEAL